MTHLLLIYPLKIVTVHCYVGYWRVSGWWFSQLIGERRYEDIYPICDTSGKSEILTTDDDPYLCMA